MTLSGVGAFAQHPAQWLIRKNLLLDFNSSPPDTVPLSDSLLVSPSKMKYLDFYSVSSNRSGMLNNLAMTAETVVNGIIFRNSHLNRIKIKSLPHACYNIQAFPYTTGYGDTQPKLHVTSTKSFAPIGYGYKRFGVADRPALAMISTKQDSVLIQIIDSSYQTATGSKTIMKSGDSIINFIIVTKDLDKPKDTLEYLRCNQFDTLGQLINSRQIALPFSDRNYKTHAIIPAHHTNRFVMMGWWYPTATDSINYSIYYYEIGLDGKPMLLKEFLILKKPDPFENFGSYTLGACFSPNDSFLYLSFTRRYQNRGPTLIRQPLYEDKKFETIPVPDSSLVQRMALGPDGQIYFRQSMQFKSFGGMGCIHFPDAKNIADIGLEFWLIKPYWQRPGNDYYFSGYEPNANIGIDLLRFKVKQPRCNADYVVTHNYSDSPIIQFTWQLLAMDSTVIQTIDGNAPKLHPPKSGDYFVKLNGRDRFGRNYWRWDKFHYNAPPQTAIEPLPPSFCANQTVKLEAKTLSDTGSINTYTWTIERENQNAIMLNGKKQEWKPSFTGVYSVKMVYNNGLCTDTAYTSFYVKQAPNPGFTLSDDTLCTGMKLTLTDTSIGEISSARYTWSDGQVYGLRAGHWRSFNKPGKYKVMQELSFLQCISRDSAIVWVRKGLSADSLTELKVASLPDNQRIELHWKPTTGIAGYVIKRLEDNTRFFISGDSMDRFMDSLNHEITQSYTYTVAAMDSCGNLGTPENLGKTVFLTATNPDNQKVELQWTPYQGWKQGVQSYTVESSADGINWDIIAGVSDTSYSDFRIPSLLIDSLYYRIKAIEQLGNRQFSYSNTVLVNTQTRIFIPNAFSPNGDGVNDIFKIGHFGIKEFSCSIFARTGQLVAYSEDPEHIWNGKSPRNEPFSPGSYTYVMKMIDHRGIEYHYSGFVVVIRSNQ